MQHLRQGLTVLVMAWALLGTAGPGHADEGAARTVLQTWMRLTLELVRHTPTYTPPVASRSFAYLGVTAYEVVVLDDPELQSLAGQLNGLTPIMLLEEGDPPDRALVLHTALSVVVAELFANTGPTGQRALATVTTQLRADLVADLNPGAVAADEELGRDIAAHILAWAATDGGAVIENMGFTPGHALTEGPGHWVPTSLVRLQQTPLLPNWGSNRPFAMPAGNSCPLPPPPAYSEDPASAFYAEAQEVVTVKAALTPEQAEIARFWADDAMLSMTPPGHWIAIAMQIFARDDMDVADQAEVLARLGVALADSFIGCWDAKFRHDLLRPVTYIRRVIDPGWEPLLLTPPFPEYPSGHSVQSGAAAAVLTAYFGEGFAFEDSSRTEDNLPVRSFDSFWDAAQEAGISRLYGGIHFRAAVEQGLVQGDCIGGYAVALQTRG